ncbi:MAG: signal peptidase I, partial [Candidatus Berkelbacteria bacterium]|nr:signal peptidase I [Candidatus Berkelbacteria bacterium]
MKIEKIGKIIYTVLFIIVIIFALLIIISAIPFPKGLRIYIVRSGSMAPTLKAGDLIFSKKQDTYSVGDIVTYIPRGESKNIESITHRIVDTKDSNFITKGDANPSEDSESVTPKQVKGRYVFRVPSFGYVVAFAKTTP